MGSSRRDPLQAEECYHNINELRRSLNITQTFTPGEDSPFDPGRLRELGVKTGGSGGRHELQAVLFNVRGQSRDLSKRAATATLQTTTPRPPGAVSKLTRTDPPTSSCATFSDCAGRRGSVLLVIISGVFGGARRRLSRRTSVNPRENKPLSGMS
jgi:hypothetical protein